ncbi:glycosyltransferase family 4 protein [Methylobacterium brachythecii]|uniref:Glycosyltransferase involved in cell wall biosynthesis n=1 Tax=Methylobacterium brachythecii TaxID=1176177 RepID=A0A7W6AFB9_9HYPH|nr:glycosyltransferase family 4 protein [Methylobacterium brachythecii]MBB3901663.1 glycosyltransferase involved in cell wall biosynthesis [Methylobacterium brachythecii]GLS43980.1 polysaccharide biosynthesis protein [Methylobacterium brachythecii]
MRVVLVLDHAHINGGQAKVALDSALGLSARGHAVTIFAAVGPVDPRLEQAGIRVVCLGQDDIESTKNKLAFAAQAIWNRKAAEALGDELQRYDPADTLVHVHAFAKSLSPSIGVPIAASGLPCLYTMHEFFLVCPNGGFYDYPSEAICHRTPMSLSCLGTNCDARSYPRKLLRVVRHVGLDHVARLPDLFRHVITISALQERVVAPLMPKGTLFHRVDNPISVTKAPPRSGPPGDFLFVGRISTEKGAPIFAEAARRAGVRPVFVGDGPSAAELKVRYPESVMLGWKNAEQVQALMREARALVFPSIWYEGQPLTVYEALAVGCPVIVSDACAGREAIEDGENGFWFRSGDPAALAAHLSRLTDDALADRLSRQAHERYWAGPLTVDAHLDRLEQVYERVAREAAGRRPIVGARAGGRAAATIAAETPPRALR